MKRVEKRFVARICESKFAEFCAPHALFGAIGAGAFTFGRVQKP